MTMLVIFQEVTEAVYFLFTEDKEEQDKFRACHNKYTNVDDWPELDWLCDFAYPNSGNRNPRLQEFGATSELLTEGKMIHEIVVTGFFA